MQHLLNNRSIYNHLFYHRIVILALFWYLCHRSSTKRSFTADFVHFFTLAAVFELKYSHCHCSKISSTSYKIKKWWYWWSAAVPTVSEPLGAVGQPDDVSVSFQDEDLVVTTWNWYDVSTTVQRSDQHLQTTHQRQCSHFCCLNRMLVAQLESCLWTPGQKSPSSWLWGQCFETFQSSFRSQRMVESRSTSVLNDRRASD